ncbi:MULTISPECIES: hypothetical protein [Haloferax]|uniref:Uncharacterized protein n=1 Tax=Haloferax marinum TaxID=2666143 RepID=A0A6A8G6N1_9EURY|nr:MULTISPECIES: hypothetical protein [Haloferax]KAB1196905.1 hypothetical protein Hfx1150_04960 [Haloferax sp. CBA1150]MRW95923.1 hypothetical protein [Haloferax marinum]
MVFAGRRLAAVREAGEVVIEVLDIGFRPTLPDFESKNLSLEDDPRYGPCLEAHKRILEEYGDLEVKSYPDAPHTRTLHATRKFNDERLCEIAVAYNASGTGQVFMIVETANDSIVPIHGDDYELERLQIGRSVAQAELAILVAELGSPAEALDYWAVNEMAPSRERYDRSPPSAQWHTIRGVTRQAVSNNVNSARRALHENSKDSDPWS